CDEEALLREELERGAARNVAPAGLYEVVAASDVAFRIGDRPDALRKAQLALAGSKAAGDHELAALASLVLAQVRQRAGKLEEARASATDAIESAERLGDTRLRAKAQLRLLAILTELREFDASAQQVRFLRASLQSLGDPPAMSLALDLREAWLLLSKGDVVQALELFEEIERLVSTRGIASPNHLGRSLAGQGSALAELGRYDEAIKIQERAVELLAKRLGRETPRVIKARIGVASGMANHGRTQEAISVAMSTVADADAVAGADSILAARARATLGIAYATNGAPDTAAPIIRAAAATLEQQLGPKNSDVATAWTNLARVLASSDKPREAVEVLEHAGEIMLVTQPPTHPDFIYVHTNLSLAHLELNEWQAAAKSARRAESIIERNFPANNARLDPVRTLLATALRGTGELEASAELLGAILARLRATSARPALIANAGYELALTVAKQNKRPEATRLMLEARGLYESEDAPHLRRLDMITAWLAEN
ncbi:MAG: tetratricopeptide repeat protein, partial [Nannocystaceae bacterium]|nr:tetratricopeptide repeat protein [Nannocystaceae bacterium]